MHSNGRRSATPAKTKPSMKRRTASRHRSPSRPSTAGPPAAMAVEKKVKKLQSLIPGGEGMRPDKLFLHTADYILHLRLQLYVLQAAYTSTATASCGSSDLDL